MFLCLCSRVNYDTSGIFCSKNKSLILFICCSWSTINEYELAKTRLSFKKCDFENVKMTCDFFLLRKTKKQKNVSGYIKQAALTAPLLQPSFFLSTTQLNITTVLLRPRVTGRNYLVYSAQLLAGIYSHSWKCEHV